MNEIVAILSVSGLFLMRVVIPVMILVGLGMIIDRWQSQREVEIQRMAKPIIVFQNIQKTDERKAA